MRFHSLGSSLGNVISKMVLGVIGVFLPFAGPTPAYSVPCASPITSLFTAGVADGFAAPTEPASPSAALQGFLGSGARRDFDQTGINRALVHTFTGLPTGIVIARLTVRLRAEGSANNDGFALELRNNSQFAWSQVVRTLAGVTTWTPPADRTFTLDLASLPASSQGVTNLLAELGDGALDVYIQDDTAVDFLQLEVTSCPPPSCAAPPWGMVGWWPLDEESGTVAADVIGHNDGTYQSSPVPVPGQVGGALSFDGIDDRVLIPDDPVLDPGTGDLSIDAWVLVERVTGGKAIVDKMDLAGGGAGYSLILAAGNGLTFAWGDQSGFSFAHSTQGTPTGNPTVPVGVWTHVAVTVDRDDPAGGRFYLDGALVNTFNPTTRPGSFGNPAPLRIGAGGIFDNAFFDGALDEVEIFHRVLSGDEIRAIYEAGADGKCKPSAHVDWDIPFCSDQRSARTSPQICNNSIQVQTYNLSFAGLTAAESGCDVDGPTAFKLLPPDTLPLLVPPRSCRTVQVEIGRPLFTDFGQQGCFRMTAESLETGEVAVAHGSAWANGVFCCMFPPPPDLPLGEQVPIRFDVTNFTANTQFLSWELDVMPGSPGAPDVVSLNDQPPGTPIRGQLRIPAGRKRQITVQAEMVRFERTPQDLVLTDRNTGTILGSTSVRSAIAGCAPGETDLCLGNGRFRVSVAWRDFQGNAGVGRAHALTSDTGYFWFFDAANVEVVLKVLDGRALNGNFWVFYGALSTVEYTISVTDTETGVSKTYFNPAGNLASVADTEALPAPLGASPAGVQPPGLAELPILAAGTCAPSSTALCLNNGRFRVEVTWKDFAGGTGVGHAVPLTTDTGYFWFFDAANVELILKVLDGTLVNGRWWVFFGALSNVEYRITVTDTQTGRIKTYTNPGGRLASVADTDAFPQ